MKHEDELRHRDSLAYHELLHGDRGASAETGDDMGHMVLGDLTEHHHHQQKKGLGTLAKMAIGAGLLGSGIGAGVGGPLLIDALKSQPTIESPVNTLEIRDWKLGEPIVE